MLKIAIINGPNLNLLGAREPGIYGSESLEDIISRLVNAYPEVEFTRFQSNVEGEIIDALHHYGFDHSGIILNAGAYTHTSLAIGDAVKAVAAPVVEVHLSNIFARESFRHVSFIGPHTLGTITGFGSDVYRLATEALVQHVRMRISQ